MIQALEDFLGVSSAGPFTPREEHANLLEECSSAFHDSAAARLRSKSLSVGFAGCSAVV